jgi:hypothetical protein
MVVMLASVFGLGGLGGLGGAPSAWAMGKKPATPPGGGCTPNGDADFVPANPIREVALKPVTTKAFNLPNGARVDLQADLDLMLSTAVTAAGSFAPTDQSGGDGGVDDPCGHRIEIRAGVSSLVLNAFELGISFGYSPSGESNTLTNLNGKTKVRVGTVAMDFSVWECTGGRCHSVDAMQANAMTAGVELELEIDFSSVTSSPALVYNTKLERVLRGVMDDGLRKLSKSARLSALSWSARVRKVVPEAGIIVFDAGANSRVGLNQGFTIYAPTPSNGACGAFEAMAYARTSQVDTVSSVALIDKVLSSRGVKEGDLVMVRAVSQ